MTFTKLMKIKHQATGKIHYSCASFCASMLHQALGVDLIKYDSVRGAHEPNIRATSFFNPKKNPAFIALNEDDVMQPGDVIVGEGYRWHAMLYIGINPETGKHQIAETGGNKSLRISDLDIQAGDQITVGKLYGHSDRMGFVEDGQTYLIRKLGHVVRLNLQEVTFEKTKDELEPPIVIEWPDRSISTYDGQLVLTDYTNEGQDLWYQGIIDMDPLYERHETTADKLKRKGIAEMIIEWLGSILTFLLSLISMVVRVPIIGLANIAETILTWILQIFSGTGVLELVDIEDIIFNRIPLLDVDIFKTIQGGAGSLSGEQLIDILHKGILVWYYAFRNMAIIAMLVALIFLGVKMAISSIAEDKAKYKKMLVDWLVSFIIIFIIHYYIVIIINTNNFLLQTFEEQMTQQMADKATTPEGLQEYIIDTQGELFEEIRKMAYSTKLLEGWLATFAYVILIWYTIKYSVRYLIRIFNVFILILLAPLIAISYAIDKIKDGKSQSLKKWMKELAFGVLVQSIHALIYTIFVSIVLIQIDTVNMGNFAFLLVLLFITFNFMDKAEELFRGIFNVKADSIAEANAIMEAKANAIATYKMVTGVVNDYKELGKDAIGAVGRALGHPLKPYLDNAKYGDAIPDKKNKGNDEEEQPKSQEDEQIDKEKLIAANKEAELKKQRKEAVKSAWDTAKSLVATIPTIVESPMVGITLLITGITGIKKTRIAINKFRTNAKMNAKPDMYAKVKLLNERKNLEIQLKEQLNDLAQDPNSIIGKQFAQNATQEQIDNSKLAYKMLVENMNLQLATIDGTTVDNAINQAILENKGKVDESTIDRISKIIEEKSGKKNTKIEINRDSVIAGVIARSSNV